MYMLDTNSIAYAKNRRPINVLQRLLSHRPEEICISAITLAELEYGACHSSDPARNRAALMAFLSAIQVLPFDSDAAREYGLIRQALSARGTPISASDLLIAAHARSLGYVLVTNNVREFERVDGLTVENWV